MKQPLACHHCRKPFPRTSGAGLFCGKDCEAEHQKKTEAHRGILALAGFTNHPETPNIWHKDGVSITEEQVKHVGMDKALRQHQGAVAEHTAS